MKYEQTNYNQMIEHAKDIPGMFDIVRKIAMEYFGMDQAGLLIGVSDLGSAQNAWLGAFYSLDANTIVLNKRPLSRIQKNQPMLYKSYLFHVLLHEYIHSLGVMDEEQCRAFVYAITKDYLGEEHPSTQMCVDMKKYIPYFTYGDNFQMPEDISIEYIHGIDRQNTNYIN